MSSQGNLNSVMQVKADISDIASLQEDDTPVKDECMAVFLIQMLFGLGFLMPFFTVLGTLDFYVKKMPDNAPKATFAFWYNMTLVPSMVIFAIYGRRFSSNLLIIGGFSGGILVFLVLTFVANIGGGAGYWACVMCLLLLGCSIG